MDTISPVKKNHIRIATIFNWLGAGAYLCAPLAVWAEAPAASTALPPVLISEVQMGSANSASEEFIELYNASSVPIDFGAHNWRLEIASSSASSWVSPLRAIPLFKSLQPGRSYIIASQYTSNGEQVQYLPNIAVPVFSPGLSYTSGHIRLLYDTMQPDSSHVCSASSTVVDELEWTVPKGSSTATQSLDGRQQYVSGKASGVAAGSSLQRQIDPVTNTYIDTNNDSADFIAGVPSPGATNSITAAHPDSNGQSQVGLPVDTCSNVPPVSGGGDTGEEDDQNSPEIPVDTSHSDETETPSDDSSDSNAGASDPPGMTANVGLQPVVVTELLPNPGSPQTDAADEFIELYNPNQSVFDLGGYQLQVGTTATHTYTFPADTRLNSGDYMAFFSATTGLSLSNSGGQVKLLDSSGRVLSASDPYGAAKDNQAWAVINGTWQWTLAPTPNAANKLAAVASATTAKTTATNKTTAKVKTTSAAKAKATKTAKTSKTAKPKANSSNTPFVADAPTAHIPVHTAVLAVIGVAAVLYGAYEYRQDVANYFRRSRENRAAGRKNRQAVEGRRNHRTG